jgi:hypothetical protein
MSERVQVLRRGEARAYVVAEEREDGSLLLAPEPVPSAKDAVPAEDGRAAAVAVPASHSSTAERCRSAPNDLPSAEGREDEAAPALPRGAGANTAASLAPAPDELEERALDLRGRLLGQVKQRRRRSTGRYRVRMQAATIRFGRRRRWLLLSDNLGSGAAAQHGPSGLRAVAGAASATSAAASSPPRKRAPPRCRGRPRLGRGMSPFALAGPAMPDGTKAIEGHLRPHARAWVRRPSARPENVPRSGW